jgi:hypothetical protein
MGAVDKARMEGHRNGASGGFGIDYWVPWRRSRRRYYVLRNEGSGLSYS